VAESGGNEGYEGGDGDEVDEDGDEVDDDGDEDDGVRRRSEQGGREEVEATAKWTLMVAVADEQSKSLRRLLPGRA